MGKYVVIGGSGFVGTRLINLCGQNRCINIDKSNSLFYPSITKIFDIRDNGLENIIPADAEIIILLAAEHRDDVSPASLYYDVNVEGTRKVLRAMDTLRIKNIVFTSSVAIFGLDKGNPDETHSASPFNNYGKSKWEAELVLREWYNKDSQGKSLTIVRPTVIFGERNRGNVFNLLNQIASGRFMMIGNGKNKKSMAYVENIASFLQFCVEKKQEGYRLYNYVDKPDLSMNELISAVEKKIGRRVSRIRLPYLFGYSAGLMYDFLSLITGRKFTVSTVRIKKFCATTQFNSLEVEKSGFVPPYTLYQGLDRTIQFEFLSEDHDNKLFYSE